MNGQKFFMDALARIPKEVDRQVSWSMLISDRLADILCRRGMSQKDFARGMGRSEAEVSRWLGGTHNFTLATLAKISQYLDEDLIRV